MHAGLQRSAIKNEQLCAAWSYREQVRSHARSLGRRFCNLLEGTNTADDGEIVVAVHGRGSDRSSGCIEENHCVRLQPVKIQMFNRFTQRM